jgi:hybrid cluster-associated redox disulfide protein
MLVIYYMNMTGNDLFNHQKSPISPQLTVAELLEHCPQVIPVFIHRQLGCVGCAMAPFDTLEDVANIYDLDIDRFMKDLKNASG